MACQEAPVSASQLLSVELWAKVFTYIYEESTDLLAIPGSSSNCCLMHTLNQANFQKLRLVCKAFDTAFDRETFTRHLVIPKLKSDQSLPSLLEFVRHHRGSLVAVISGFGSAPVDSVLAALSSASAPNLTALAFTDISRSSMHRLSAFTTVTSISLATPFAASTALCALKYLPSLTFLFLSGLFDHLSAAVSLTELKLSSAFVTTCECSFVTSLRKLAITGSLLLGIHPKGLSACNQLEVVMCRESHVPALQRPDSFCCDIETATQSPAGWSSASHLTSLCIEVDCSPGDHIDLQWVFQITSLRHLDLDCLRSVHVPDELTLLTHLTYLKIWQSTDPDKRFCTSFKVNWQAMQNLHVLKICGMYRFGRSILGLVQLTKLKAVHFVGCSPFDNTSAGCMTALAHALGAHCPQVEVWVNADTMYDLIASPYEDSSTDDN